MPEQYFQHAVDSHFPFLMFVGDTVMCLIEFRVRLITDYKHHERMYTMVPTYKHL